MPELLRAGASRQGLPLGSPSANRAGFSGFSDQTPAYLMEPVAVGGEPCPDAGSHRESPRPASRRGGRQRVRKAAPPPPGSASEAGGRKSRCGSPPPRGASRRPSLRLRSRKQRLSQTGLPAPEAKRVPASGRACLGRQLTAGGLAPPVTADGEGREGPPLSLGGDAETGSEVAVAGRAELWDGERRTECVCALKFTEVTGPSSRSP